MRKFIIAIMVVVFSLVSCNPKGTIDSYSSPMHTEMIGHQAIKAYQYVLDRPGFNKTCKDEGISSDLEKWSKTAFKSYEDNTRFIQYYFIKDSVDSNEGIANKMFKLDLEVKKDTIFVLEIRKTIYVK